MLIPSLEEAFGLTAAEASAAGTPVVTLKGSGTEDIILHDHNGYVCNEKEFIKNVLFLINSEEKLKKFGDNGPKYINERFNPEKIAKQYISLYEEILV